VFIGGAPAIAKREILGDEVFVQILGGYNESNNTGIIGINIYETRWRFWFEILTKPPDVAILVHAAFVDTIVNLIAKIFFQIRL
jgi:hypothetical protein